MAAQHHKFRPPAFLRRPGMLLAAICLVLLTPPGLSQPASTSAAVPKKIRVGVLVDNYPFSFREPDGQVRGFAYELVQEIEQVMGLHFERVVGTTKEINGAFEAGQIDLLQSLARTPERERTMEFSVPYLNMTGQIFVRKGETQIHSLADLRGRKVLVHRGSLGESLLLKSGLQDSIQYVESVERSLVLLDRGTGDATLATRLTGLSLAHHLGLTQVRVLDVNIEGFEVNYCVAAQKGDHATLARINEGMAVLVRTGKFDALYQKWFGFVTPTGYTTEQILLAVAVGLTLALAVALWAVRRQRALTGLIARQTTVLQRSEASLAAAQARAHLGSWEFDLTGLRNSWSAEMARLHYCDPKREPPPFAEFLELVHPEDRAGVKEMQSRVAAATNPTHHEYRTNPVRGPLRHLSTTLHVVRDTSGQAIYVAGTTLDITEQKIAAAAEQFANRRLKLIAQMTDTIIGTSTTAEVAQRLAILTKECFEVDACVIRMLEGEHLVLLGAHGIPAGELVPQLPLLGLAAKVITSRKALLVPDVRADPLAQELAQLLPGSFRFVSYAGVPLFAGGQAIGLLGIYTVNAPRAYTEVDAEHLQIIANHAAVSLANERLFKIVRTQKTELEATIGERERAEARLQISSQQLRALGARLETLREAERVRISREIHDVLGQKLTALKMDLYWLEKKLPQVGDQLLRAALEDKIVVAAELADEIVVAVQRIAAELRPATLDNLGLVATLQHEAKQFEARTGISIQLQLPTSPLNLDNQVSTTAYRIFQEVLTNIIRHARATQVRINLEISPTQLRLCVADNGIGVSPADLAAAKSLGLLGMTERAAMVNGQMHIQGAPGQGTTVQLEIPIENPPRSSNKSSP